MQPEKQDQVPPMSYVSRMDFLRARVRGKQVLHLGCSSGRYIRDHLERGSLLHAILREEARELHGMDIDTESVALMRELGFENIHEGNAERLDELGVDTRFDALVAGDLLEHLTRPGDMLEGAKRLLKPSGELVISTNNAFGLHFQIRRWLGQYVEHFEHVCFFSPETLLHLFERHGYRVTELYGAYTKPPHMFTQKIKFAVGKPLFKMFPVLAGTLIVVARPET